MKIKFTTTKESYSRQFVHQADKDSFYELKVLVNNNNDEAAIDNWFNKQKLSKKSKANLAYAIGQTTYYFSLSNAIFLTREAIEELRVQSQVHLLKHFSIEDQIKILVQEHDLESPKIFKLMYETAKKENKIEALYNNRILLDLLFKLFNEEEFEKIKNIEVVIYKNIETINTRFMAFMYNNAGSYYNKLENNYNITDEIILNYTKEKEEFLTERNQQLPSQEKAAQLLEDIKNNYSSREWMSVSDKATIEKIKVHVNNYIKTKMCIDLDESLSDKNIRNKAKKI